MLPALEARGPRPNVEVLGEFVVEALFVQGNYSGYLSGQGETIELADETGTVVDMHK